MLSELVRVIYDSAGMDWQTAEKIAYAVLTYMETKMPPEDFAVAKRYMIGDVEYVLPDRSAYPGYAGELPDQARE
jgi:hypothetical protein